MHRARDVVNALCHVKESKHAINDTHHIIVKLLNVGTVKFRVVEYILREELWRVDWKTYSKIYYENIGIAQCTVSEVPSVFISNYKMKVDNYPLTI